MDYLWDWDEVTLSLEATGFNWWGYYCPDLDMFSMYDNTEEWVEVDESCNFHWMLENLTMVYRRDDGNVNMANNTDVNFLSNMLRESPKCFLVPIVKSRAEPLFFYAKPLWDFVK